MKLEIIHHTRYKYSWPVTLQPQFLRLLPRQSQHQSVDEFFLEVHPAPVHQRLVQGFEGSICHHLIFQGQTTEFSITATSILETRPALVLPWIYPYSAQHLPFGYSVLEQQLLAPFMESGSYPRRIRQFSDDILQQSHADTAQFLNLLMLSLSEQINKEYREVGWPFPPEETLEKKCGSCRDISVLFMACARYVGLAARFVSGYIYDANRAENSELHAWVEVYLPGSGWVGYDPTYGLFAGENHIDICASAFPQLCAPVEGFFTGTAEQTMEATVRILAR
jgi:transglutaminase-like putative cysteine protease